MVFTAPTGHTYTTEPHGGALFPALAHPTGELPDVPLPAEAVHRDAMMPTRRQTREQDRQDRITKERRERQELNRQTHQEESKSRAWLAANEKPPPS